MMIIGEIKMQSGNRVTVEAEADYVVLKVFHRERNFELTSRFRCEHAELIGGYLRTAAAGVSARAARSRNVVIEFPGRRE